MYCIVIFKSQLLYFVTKSRLQIKNSLKNVAQFSSYLVKMYRNLTMLPSAMMVGWYYYPVTILVPL